MPRTGLTAEELRIRAIDVALVHMRTHGVEKVRLSDVARDLGVSHAALYSHFEDKGSLLDAVTERWLRETDARLEMVCQVDKPALDRIRDWFVASYRIKRERVLRDPNLYRAFDTAAALRKPYVALHLATAQRQLVGLLSEAATALPGDTSQRQAALLFAAMSAFHHPKMMTEHLDADGEPLLERVLDAVLRGMKHAG